jgi:uncharacterized protein (DUF2164 family)
MAIELDDQTRRRLVESIKHYFAEDRGEEIGDLQASFLLDFVLREVGPAVYNCALADAQAYLRNVVGDLDVTLGE